MFLHLNDLKINKNVKVRLDKSEEKLVLIWNSNTNQKWNIKISSKIWYNPNGLNWGESRY